MSADIKILLSKLLDKDPDTRPDANALMMELLVKKHVEKIIRKVSEADVALGHQLYNQLTEHIPKIESLTHFLNQSLCTFTNEEKLFLKRIVGYNEPVTSLLYRGSRDGWTYADFHKLCDEKGPTITLFKVKDGPCIGGFTAY